MRQAGADEFGHDPGLLCVTRLYDSVAIAMARQPQFVKCEGSRVRAGKAERIAALLDHYGRNLRTVDKPCETFDFNGAQATILSTVLRRRPDQIDKKAIAVGGR